MSRNRSAWMALALKSGEMTATLAPVMPWRRASPATARALLIGFPTTEAAGDCVGRVIAAGIIPGGMEIMDRAAVEAAEAFCHAGYPLDAGALLIVE
ncbi:hypothetical protein IIA79_08500, partial [bacterium]|nr:hypothetical protein [bacterium]